MKDLFGKALLDYQTGKYSEDIGTFSSLDERDLMPLPYLFREYSQMPILEQRALDMTRGKVLDIGCGSGSHSLYLQKKGFAVTALDQSEGAIKTCQLRNIQKTVHSDIYSFTGEKFDTLLMLMNGIGVVGRLKNLGLFLEHLKTLLKPKGQILLDSSDIIYMFEEDDDGGRWVPDKGSYYGEVEFTLSYKGLKSEPFFWLYVDYCTLERSAMVHGLNIDCVSYGEHYDYLARLWVD